MTTISEFTKTELLSLKLYKTPIKVIPNPLTISFQYSPKLDWSYKVKILHVGTKENKNLIRLTKALNGVNCFLTIIGKLNSEQEFYLNTNNIDYINKINVSESELKEEYKLCDLLAFVSTYEGFGLPIIEAQALGRVVLASNISSIPEIAGDGAYLVDPYSVDQIKDAILYLSKNRNVRLRLIENGKVNVERFRPELIAEMYNKLYMKVGA